MMEANFGVDLTPTGYRGRLDTKPNELAQNVELQMIKVIMLCSLEDFQIGFPRGKPIENQVRILNILVVFD